ncbi:hypothetical protein [Nostoc piscinale]|nr:hypothetical protein [Nostoc piscinale]
MRKAPLQSRNGQQSGGWGQDMGDFRYSEAERTSLSPGDRWTL